MKHLRLFWIVLPLLALAPPVWAEATGGYSGLGRALTQMFFYAVGYLALIITLIVLAVRRKGKALAKVAIIAFAVTIAYPLADMALMQWQKSRVAAAEVRKPAPDLREKTILYVETFERCYNTPCQALIELQKEQPLWTIPVDVFESLDFSQPIDLATVPLAQWEAVPETFNTLELNRDPKGPRPEFDYLVVSRSVYYKNRKSDFADHLPGWPTSAVLGQHLSLTDLAAPIANNTIDLSQIEPDLLSLYISRKARLAPLFVENTMRGSDRGWEWRRSRADWFCGEAANAAPEQYGCRDELD